MPNTISENHASTIARRETSFEDLADSFANRDEIYSLINDNPRGSIFRPHISITQRDIEEVPGLAALRRDIQNWEALLKRTEGKPAYLIKRALIQMRKDQYLMKQEFRHPISFNAVTHSQAPHPPLPDTSYFDIKTKTYIAQGVSLASPKAISAILSNYSRLKQDSAGCFDSDLYWLLEDFDRLADYALAQLPIYEAIATLKIDGKTNAEIAEYIYATFNKRYSPGYISSIWCNKIPQTIALTAARYYTERAFRQHNLPFKQCSRCGKLKPASPLFFTHNSSSKDSYYSICKNCRAKGKKV